MKNFLAILSDNRSSLFISHCPNLCVRVFTLLSDPFFNRPPDLSSTKLDTGTGEITVGEEDEDEEDDVE